MVLGIHNLNKNLQGYVIGCGLVYGMGEDQLFGMFKQALEQKQPLKIYGRGNNYIPTIHVDDLAQFAHDLAFNQNSSPGFHIAIDHSNVTQKEIV